MARHSTFTARSYRDRALILRHHKLGEADRIIVMLSAEHGQIRAVAKGVRRTSSKFGAVLEMFMLVDIQLAHGKNLDTITQAQMVSSYGAQITSDYARYTAGTVMAETAERLTRADADSTGAHFRLLHGALHALAAGYIPALAVMDSYLLRALGIAGWAASFSDCVRCGTPGPHASVNVALGGAVCPECRPAGSRSPAPETIELLDALLAGDWERVRRASPQAAQQAGEIVTEYVQWHLERSVKSLKFVDRAEAEITRG